MLVEFSVFEEKVLVKLPRHLSSNEIDLVPKAVKPWCQLNPSRICLVQRPYVYCTLTRIVQQAYYRFLKYGCLTDVRTFS